MLKTIALSALAVVALMPIAYMLFSELGTGRKSSTSEESQLRAEYGGNNSAGHHEGIASGMGNHACVAAFQLNDGNEGIIVFREDSMDIIEISRASAEQIRSNPGEMAILRDALIQKRAVSGLRPEEEAVLILLEALSLNSSNRGHVNPSS
jgi:hypothetical protein